MRSKRSSGAGGRDELSNAARSLIDSARGHQLGIEFVMQGLPESVAAIHRVHADAVHEARGYLSSCGVSTSRIPEEAPGLPRKRSRRSLR